MPRGGVQVYLYYFFNLGARRGGWLKARIDRFTPGKETVPIVWGDGLAPGPFWTGAENLAPTGIRSLDRPTRGEYLQGG